MSAPLSVNVPVNSQIEVNDSCNNCCCFKFRRKPKVEQTLRKVERQRGFINLPAHAQRSITVTHIDKINITTEEVDDNKSKFDLIREEEERRKRDNDKIY